MSPSNPTRIVDLVRRWEEQTPDRVCLTVWQDDHAPDRVTYRALWQEVLALAALFSAEDLRPGAPIVIFAPSVSTFASAFLAAQKAGLVPIPIPPPDHLGGTERALKRITQILDRSQARTVFAPSGGTRAGDIVAPDVWTGIRWLTPNSVGSVSRTTETDAWTSVGCCQFTSGSGGRPNGVLLTHENMLANIRGVQAVWNLGEQDVAVYWLPLFHDMGLFALLRSLVIGFPLHLIPPMAFLLKPVTWLSLISELRGTCSGAPNFGFALCVQRITEAELARLDLSSWRVTSNGAEPVSRAVVEAFTTRFARCGFRPEAMVPSYGLAENTLIATTSAAGSGIRFDEVSREGLEREGIARRAGGPGDRRWVASVGRPLPGQDVAIFDPAGSLLEERRVGEVGVRGDSVMHGYLRGSDADAGSTVRSDGWLLTGDLGYLAGGELFITGRKKDLIIRLGRNYDPQELEVAAWQVPGVRTGRAAAFTVPGAAQERVVLMVECRHERDVDANDIRAAIRQAVFAAVGFVPDDIVLLPPRALPLTTSGKLMRPEARRLYVTHGARGA
jgi:acyl-CoA synthetase (AMP-forming)/AMP-acid ligase II